MKVIKGWGEEEGGSEEREGYKEQGHREGKG